jgi:CubicO group peptidase (beta-lactamase class C family)
MERTPGWRRWPACRSATNPGERLHYSHATEVLGFIVARIAGPARRRAAAAHLRPLGMKDTAFHVPPRKRDRAAVLYRFDEAAEKLVPVPMPHYDTAPAYQAGGGGLWSTVDDYLRFARALLNDGEVDGVRLLQPETVRDMRTNRLTPSSARCRSWHADVGGHGLRPWAVRSGCAREET